MTKKKVYILLRCVLFFFVLAIVIYSIQSVFTVDSHIGYEHIHDYYSERKNSLDAVCLGASNITMFWQPLLGWKDHGIAVWNFTVDATPMKAIKNLMIEARKTQPDALYIISLNQFKKPTTKSSVAENHRVIDFLPLSNNKIELIQKLTEDDPENRLEYFFPIMRFHSRWDELNHFSFGIKDTDYKSSAYEERFCTRVENVEKYLKTYKVTASVSEDVLPVFEDLLQYCGDNQVNALFIVMPQVMSKREQAQVKKLKEIAEEQGYPCLDLMPKIKELNLNPQTDYYDKKHTNAHGWTKVSTFLGNYLVEHYGFSDKRGLAEWKDWDDSAKKYNEYLKQYLLPFELDHSERTNLSSPPLNKLKINGQTITISWKTVDGADGYAVYCKDGKEWKYVDAVNSKTLQFENNSLEPDTKYTFTVVPYLNQKASKEKQYGHFNVTGVSGTTEGK